MKTIKLSQASRPLAEYAAELGDDIVVLTDRDRPVAAIVPLKRIDPESLALSNHPEFISIIEWSRADVRAGRTVSLDALKQESLVRSSPSRRRQLSKGRPVRRAKRGRRKRVRG